MLPRLSFNLVLHSLTLKVLDEFQQFQFVFADRLFRVSPTPIMPCYSAIMTHCSSFTVLQPLLYHQQILLHLSAESTHEAFNLKIFCPYWLEKLTFFTVLLLYSLQ